MFVTQNLERNLQHSSKTDFNCDRQNVKKTLEIKYLLVGTCEDSRAGDGLNILKKKLRRSLRGYKPCM